MKRALAWVATFALAACASEPTPAPPAPTPTAFTSPPTASPVPSTGGRDRLSLASEGINVANYDAANIAPLGELGFGWIQVFNPPDFPIAHYRVLYRVPLNDAVSGDPAAIARWADQLESLARERRGVIHAYAIGNEVNLSREWGGGQPDPDAYARLLAIAYARIKTADPDALVISAGIAPTAGNSPGAMDDLEYARALFELGAADYLDAYGFHPYGFAYEPERDPRDPATGGLVFRRAELHRALMESYGAGDKQMWATEFGWLADPAEEGLACTLPGMDWQRVSRAQQAEYVLRAFRFARQHWHWMGPMFLWNYDFSRSPLHPDPCEQMKFYAMLDAAGNPRPLFTALREATQP